MSIAEKLKKIGHKETGVRHFCLQTIRFKKLLENARGVLDLFADGREKLQGEYIFDRHYVVSLIDSVLDRLKMMVYDAAVLVPAHGEALFAAYDAHKQAARKLILPGRAVSTGSDFDDPEYQLLAEALLWFNGTAVPEDQTVMGFIKQTFFYVINGLPAPDVLPWGKLSGKIDTLIVGGGLYVIDLWKDVQSLSAHKRTLADFNHTPLRHLLMAASLPAEPDWIAAVSEYQMSLQSIRPDFGFRLETLASGYEPSDFIFIFTDNVTLLDKILPPGFHIESTDFGQFAWSLDLSAKTIEDTLMNIGRKLFDESLRRS